MTTLESRPPGPEGRPEDLADNDQKPCGHGRMLRKEDPRFIRGRGTYVDDVVLPGMLHLAILRSPFAHARIANIDVTAAQAHPKVKAVVLWHALAINLMRGRTLRVERQAEAPRRQVPAVPEKAEGGRASA